MFFPEPRKCFSRPQRGSRRVWA